MGQRHRRVGTPRAGRTRLDELGIWVLWALILIPPLVFDPATKDSFRLPKQLVSEFLALASVLFLCLRLRHAGRIDWRLLGRHPAVLASFPLLVAASVSALLSDHPLHAYQGWTSLATGVIVLVGWSLALSAEETRRLLNGMVVPATILALFAILQSHGIFDPFEIEGRTNVRRGLTSLAGGVLDLAAYLVLPALVMQSRLYRAQTPRGRLGWGLLLCCLLYALARSQTLTAMAALCVGSFVFWALLLPRRRVLLVGALLALTGAGLVLGVTPLRERMGRQVHRLSEGRVNDMLTGRLDGWRAAVYMWRNHPGQGVGLGSFTTEFADAKLQLSSEGVRFFDKHFEPHFASAHNEFLEVAAESGVLGILALAWGIFVVSRALAGRSPEEPSPPAEPGSTDFAVMSSGWVALTVLALAAFPMHLSIVAYPYLLLVGWILSPASAREGEPAPQRGDAAHLTGHRFFWILMLLLAAALWFHGRQSRRYWRASRILRAVETVTLEASQRGQFPRRIGDVHLRLLNEAQELNPALVDVPVARGWQYLLLDRPQGAIRAFEEALALEPRARVYANLGEARLKAGDKDEARQAFERALELDPRLGKELRGPLSQTR